MSLRFGTDGVRGDAARDLSPRFVYALGRAAAEVLGPADRFVVVRDSRESGPRIATDLIAGLDDAGVSASYLGLAPTPVAAYLGAVDAIPAAVVSASHNPWFDNGVKLFAAGGSKLDDDAEAAIEERLATWLDSPEAKAHRSGDSELPQADEAELSRYTEHITSVLSGRRLNGLRVVVDCANGAASDVAPAVLRRLGAQVVAIHASPDGRNINDRCGSTDPTDLASAVVAGGADVGLAFDGDADRLIAVDADGEIVDGDQMIVIAALDLHDRGLLTGEGVAVTVMSNLGLRQALKQRSVSVVTTPVGDRHVLAAMAEHGLVLGGEQSGHIVFARHATTGDGLLTAVEILDVMRRQETPLSELAAQMRRYPQVLTNVALGAPVSLDRASGVWDAVATEEEALGGQGRVLVRASGTEPVVRVMVEAADRAHAEAVAQRLAHVVEGWFSSQETAS